jgi:hypothetical protein
MQARGEHLLGVKMLAFLKAVIASLCSLPGVAFQPDRATIEQLKEMAKEWWRAQIDEYREGLEAQGDLGGVFDTIPGGVANPLANALPALALGMTDERIAGRWLLLASDRSPGDGLGRDDLLQLFAEQFLPDAQLAEGLGVKAATISQRRRRAKNKGEAH